MVDQRQAAVLDRLRRGAGLEGLGLATIDGRFDLKSFGSSFEGCSFDRASLRDATSGARSKGRPSTYRNATFVGAGMGGCLPLSAEFTGCDFSTAKLKGVEFTQARLTRCRFAGRLEGVRFAAGRKRLGVFGHDETLVDVDFSGATFRWVEFLGLNLDRVRLPSDEAHILVTAPRCVLERVLDEVRADPAPDADRRGLRAIMRYGLDHLGPAQTQMVFAVDDLAETDEGRDLAAALLRRAAASCAAA